VAISKKGPTSELSGEHLP